MPKKKLTGMAEMFDSVETKPQENKVAKATSTLKNIKTWVESDYEYITEAWQAEDAIRSLLDEPLIGFDCETVGLDPRTGSLRLIQLGTSKTSYLFDCFKLDPKITQKVFDYAKRITGFHLEFDLSYIMHNGIEIPNGDRLYDCQLAAQVLWAGTPKGMWTFCSLANVSSEIGGIYVDKEFQNSDWANPNLTSDQLQYAAYDTFLPIKLANEIASTLHREGLRETMRIENRCLPAVVWMDYNGALIDVDAWNLLIDDSISEQRQLMIEMNAEAGVNQAVFGSRMLNWNSPDQVTQIFRKREHDITSSNKSVLVQLAAQGDRLADLMVRYRKAKTRETRYGQAFLEWINPVTGRIHAQFLQMGASESGRMSCIKPNMQNIPRDKRYRACFIAPPGFFIIGADYNQIELRLAAVIARDPVLLAAYLRGDDVHSLTAQRVMGIQGKPDPDQRFKAKAVNFGFIYGMGAEKFQRYAYDSYGVRLTIEEAQEFRTAFFDLYKGIRQWHNRQPRISTETRTIVGRRSLEVDKFSEKLNYPVQGSAGDITKIALANMWEHRHESTALPFSVIHDEILSYSPEGNVESDKPWVETQMAMAGNSVLTDLPIVAEAGHGLNWKEAKL